MDKEERKHLDDEIRKGKARGETYEEIGRRIGQAREAVRSRWYRIRNLDPDSEQQIAALADEKMKLERQIDLLRGQLRKVPLAFDGEACRFGIVSDPHMGSLYENTALLEEAYRRFSREGITTVFNPGDVLEGQYTQRRNRHQFEIRVHGMDAQVENAITNYPSVDGITTYFIDGNHDDTFFQIAGATTGRLIEAGREDLVYLGPQEADMELETPRGNVTVRMFHPLDASYAYAISYKPQKIVESFSGGHKPHLLLLGHYHKSEFFFYRNVHVFQCGTCQYQTPYLRGKKVAVMMGFWIVELVVNEAGVASCTSTWFPDYD